LLLLWFAFWLKSDRYASFVSLLNSLIKIFRIKIIKWHKKCFLTLYPFGRYSRPVTRLKSYMPRGKSFQVSGQLTKYKQTRQFIDTFKLRYQRCSSICFVREFLTDALKSCNNTEASLFTFCKLSIEKGEKYIRKKHIKLIK
jgi:hypothetical protein